MSRVSERDLDVYDDNDDMMMNDEGQTVGEKVKEKAMWGVFWSAIFFILVIFLALWLFNWYRRWKLQTAAQSLSGTVQNFGRNLISAFNPQNLPSYMGQTNGDGFMGLGTPDASTTSNAANSSSMMPPSPPTMMSPNYDNMSHQVMMSNPMQGQMQGQMPSQPSSPMSDGEQQAPANIPSPNDVYGSHRLYFWYQDSNSRDSKKMYRDFSRLRDKCQKDRKFNQYGNISCHKYDLSKPQFAQFFNNLAQNSPALAGGNVPMPLMTFGAAGQPGEMPLDPNNSEKQLQAMLQSQQQ